MAEKENKPNPHEDAPKPKDRQVKSDQVKVRALHPLGEDGERYEKGSTFETTAERAKALGSIVEVIK